METLQRHRSPSEQAPGVPQGWMWAQAVVSLCLSPSFDEQSVFTAVWAQASGLEHETPLSLTRICGSFVYVMVLVSVSVCWWGAGSRYCRFGYRPFGFSQQLQLLLFLCVGGLATVIRDFFLCKVLRRTIRANTVTIDLHEDAATTAPGRLDNECEAHPE